MPTRVTTFATAHRPRAVTLWQLRRVALVVLASLSGFGSAQTAATPALGAGQASVPADRVQPSVRITGVLFDGVLAGEPEPDSAIRIENIDSAHSVSLAGFTLVEPDASAARAATDRGMDVNDEYAFDNDGTKRTKHKSRSTGVSADSSGIARRIRFPEGATLAPLGVAWVASSGAGFRQVFGRAPDYEATDSSAAIPDMSGGGFLKLAVDHGVVALLDPNGMAVDVVPYESTADGYFTVGAFDALGWKGPPVRVRKSSFYGWAGQVLHRDRDEAGRAMPDSDTAQDWDAGFSRKTLGEDPTHRVELAGQSQFISRPLKNVRAKVLATSAPDNNYAALIDALDAARASVRVRLYELTNPKIVEALVKAKRRGVDVTIFLEGSPVGGIADQERYLADRAFRAGIPVWFLASPKGQKIKPRYRFDHSKYVIIDDSKVIIGSENYGRTGVPVFNSYGNRGWMVHIEQPEFVKQLRAVWDADFRPGAMVDVLSIDASPSDAYGLPYRDPAFKPDETFQRGLYADAEKPVSVDVPMDLELVMSPDTSLNENSAIIGLINRAKKTLYIEQNSIRRRWGKKNDSSDANDDARDDVDNAPNLPLQAVLKAARRGVAVRVLLDSTWYNVQGDEDRDNDNTVLWLNDIAQKEGLDISAKVINLDTTHLEKIHTKGIVVDDAAVFVGSINWTENSFKGNREIGVVISQPKIAGYYAELFRRDWSLSRIYQADVQTRSAVRSSCSRTGPVTGNLAHGDHVVVVGEHHNKDLVCAEIQLAPKRTAFVDRNTLGVPEATPGEAIHVVGRDAVIIGRVAGTNVTDHRVQLRFADDTRPPFTAVIFKRNEQAFTARGMPPASAFQGRQLRVRGKVTVYKGPEILITEPSQIDIVP